MSRMRFSGKKIAFLFVLFMLVRQRNRKKKQNEKGPNNPIKIGILKVVIQKWKEVKNGFFFGKKCLTLFVSGREKKAHFRAHYLFCSFFAQNSANQEKL